jgi:predicted F0F1-ATPase subunit
MADPEAQDYRRDDARERARRDFERRQRREPASRFWRAVSLIGSVGWPIVLLSTGGALLGRWADHRWDTGVRFTLMLLTMGTALGTWIAFRTLRGDS